MTLARGPFAGTLGYEVLGSDDGAAFTSFQTRLGALFRFQGWAGRFTVTPPNGLHDLYATLKGGWQQQGRFDGVTLQATWHRFRSDRLDIPYDVEIDLLASVKLGRSTISSRYARYRADQFATDTDKFWLSYE